MKFESIKNILQQCKGIDIEIQKSISNCEDKKLQLENKLKLTEEAQIFLQSVAQSTQEKLRFQVEDIVNLALETCFPSEYTFKINFKLSRGKTEAEMKFLSQKTGLPIDPMNASGGGVVDLTSFALRIASWVLERDTDNVIILDEPFRFVSRDLVDRAGKILKVLSEKMNLQVILVTHIPELIDVADRVFEVKKNSEKISKIRIS